MRNFPPQYNLQANDVLYFSHIPKTAGMTFRTIVEDQFHCHEVCPATLNAQVMKIPPEELQQYRLFRGHLGFINLPEMLPQKRVINVTVLREPVARVISHYDYILRMPGDPHYKYVKDMTLEEFAQKLTAGKVGKNIQTYHLAKAARFRLDSLSPDEILELAKASLDQFAFVGLVERFQDSLFLLSYIFGWRPILNSRKENAATVKKAKEAIPESTLEVIRENTQLDQVLYEHAKAIFDERFNQMQRDLLSKYGAEVALDQVGDPNPVLSTEQLVPLLDKHADQRYRELQIPPASTVVYDFCQPLRGSGWQRREYLELAEPAGQEPLSYRWIGPNTEATLELPVATDQDLYLEFRLICTEATLPEIVNSLTLAVNGQPLPFYKLHSDKGVQVLQARIPQAVLQSDRPFTRITFRVSRTIVLNSINPLNPDMRLVGLAFNVVQMFPLHLEGKRSIVAPLSESPPWRDAIAFLHRHARVEEPVVAPIVIKGKLPHQVYDYAAALEKGGFNWVAIHKGRVEAIDALFPHLFGQGLAPVYANEVFVILTRHRHVPKVSYWHPHVKPLYVDYVKRNVVRIGKSIRTAWLRATGAASSR
ncbi:MAG: sulfotransferase family 2 domain-containing protein [Synechococcales cyanobacterium C42_A2020_086]|jgi:hypothetical protein|nr:sulfotransferase family 2 domain-containing protein [Synechococcales cyanobacterium C42_A2020_086]